MPSAWDSPNVSREFIKKPWGSETIWAHSGPYLGKTIDIHQGGMLSRQLHVEKDETILIIEGLLTLEIGRPGEEGFRSILMAPGDSHRIVPGTVHRFCALDGAVSLIEVSTPHPDDVVRLEDKYGRV